MKTSKYFLQTERVYLRQFIEEDVYNLYLLNSNPDVMKYIGDGTLDTFARTQERMPKVLAYYEKYPGLGNWVAIQKSDQTFMGWFCLKYLGQTEEVELGYRLMPVYWGEGYATEVSKTLVSYGFQTLGLKRIVGIAKAGNIASQRVLEKVGMKYEKQAFFYHTEVRYYGVSWG